MPSWTLHLLDTPEEMLAVEKLQRLIWPGSDLRVVPAHTMLTAVHNGGIVIGAFAGQVGDINPFQQEKPDLRDRDIIGFVFGFPGMYFTPDGPRSKHVSHLLAVHPQYRDQGVGFALKRAQWQMARRQGLDCITWVYDPLDSKNAYLNITRLGAVCSVYRRDYYGPGMWPEDSGLPSDRFQVDWWINTKRVNRRLSKQARLQLDLAHVLATGAEIANPTRVDDSGLPRPPTAPPRIEPQGQEEAARDHPIQLIEIPSDFQQLKERAPDLALEWRMHTRQLFEALFALGYLVTDFIHLPGASARSFYILSHGESTF